MIDLIERIGPYLGIAAFLGLAVLAFLIFQQAREVRRLREWAGRAPERLDEAEEATSAVSEARGEEPEVRDEPPEMPGRIGTALGGVRPLTADERATLAEQVPNGQPTPPAQWTAGEHEAYLDSRPDETSPFNPAADYGDPDWREPVAGEEAAARTAWLAENTPPAPGWSLPPSTEVDGALDAARERAVHSDWAHDHDPQAWAQYRRLEALADLAPLPQRDALDDPEHDNPEHDNLEHDEPDARNHDDGQLQARNDPQRLRQRIEDLRTAIAAREASAQGEVDGEQRREQLARWHDDDNRPASTATDGGLSAQYTQVGDGDGEPGWSR